MKRTPLNRTTGIRKARQLKTELVAQGVQFTAMYLYGSVAQNRANEWSDIDIAIICRPFKSSRHEENMEIRRIRRKIDVRIEPICLHLEDFQNKYFGLPHEVKKTGVEV